MRLRATCQLCTEDFQLSEVYNTPRDGEDRCPSCGAHLGVSDVGQVLRRLDVISSVLLAELRDLSEHGPVFDLDLRPLVRELAARAPERHTRSSSERRRRQVA